MGGYNLGPVQYGFVLTQYCTWCCGIMVGFNTVTNHALLSTAFGWVDEQGPQHVQVKVEDGANTGIVKRNL